MQCALIFYILYWFSKSSKESILLLLMFVILISIFTCLFGILLRFQSCLCCMNSFILCLFRYWLAMHYLLHLLHWRHCWWSISWSWSFSRRGLFFRVLRRRFSLSSWCILLLWAGFLLEGGPQFMLPHRIVHPIWAQPSIVLWWWRIIPSTKVAEKVSRLLMNYF